MAGHASPLPRILHADEWLLVVNKPPGVLSVPDRQGHTALPELLRPLLLQSLSARSFHGPDGGTDAPILPVHRLDRDASGVIVLARSRESQRRLSEQFAHRTVEKTYLALVRGYVTRDGEIDKPLLVDRERMIVRVDARKGKPAVTPYRIVERLAGHTLLECRPRTGRLHQIRVHLASMGHPLAVDPLYGSAAGIFLSRYKPDYRPSARHDERPLISRLTLHAASIAFDHPAGTGRIRVEAAPPKDFRAILRQLSRCMAKIDDSSTP